MKKSVVFFSLARPNRTLQNRNQPNRKQQVEDSRSSLLPPTWWESCSAPSVPQLFQMLLSPFCASVVPNVQCRCSKG
jgi:hypothetical protein